MYILEDVELKYDTGKAWLARLLYEEEYDDDEYEEDVDMWWIPISLIEETDMDEIGDTGSVSVPFWFAVKHNMPEWEKQKDNHDNRRFR